MMGTRFLQKISIITKTLPAKFVRAGVDFSKTNDLYLQTVYSFYEMGGEKVWDKDRAAFVFDHYVPAPTIQSAKTHSKMRDFAKKLELLSKIISIYNIV